MLTWILSNLASIESVIIIAGAIIGGFFAFYGNYGAGEQSIRSENAQIAQNLIDNYKETITQQNEKINDLQKAMDAHTVVRNAEIKQLHEELNLLKGRNSILEELFKGRDPAQDAMFKQAPELFAMVRENNEQSKANSIALGNLTKTLDEFIHQATEVLKISKT